jgi:hypothetical protein
MFPDAERILGSGVNVAEALVAERVKAQRAERKTRRRSIELNLLRRRGRFAIFLL